MIEIPKDHLLKKTNYCSIYSDDFFIISHNVVISKNRVTGIFIFILFQKDYMEQAGASVVITHQIKDGKQQAYDDWLNEIGPVCKSYPGNIDMQIIRPIAGLTFTYTVIIRFDTIANLKSWMESATRKRLIEKATSLFDGGDNYMIKSGLDFLFTTENEKGKIPVRWKQWLVTWSAIFPLSVLMPLLILPLLKLLHVPHNAYLNAFFISGTIVFIMVYLLMPHYTKLVKKWLYK
jgi:uncharacterized protein